MRLLLFLLLSSCTAPAYDAQGNGTRWHDKAARWGVHTVNGEHY